MVEEHLDLPSVSPEQLLVNQILGQRQNEFAIEVNGERWDISLGSNGTENMPAHCLMLEINHQPVTLFTGSALIDRMMPVNLESKVLLRLPRELMLAALEAGLQKLLEGLMQSLGVPVRLTDLIVNGAQSEPAELVMNIQVAGRDYPIYFQSTPIVLELLKLLPAQIKPKTTDVSVWAGLELGRAKVSNEEAGNLGVNDIVFFDYHVTGQQLIIRLSPDIAFIGEAEESQITIKHRMDPMANDQMHHDQNPIDLSDIDVELVFEVGRQQFSAEEVQSLQPGHIFDLDRPIEQPVRVKAGGKVIAECQLVQINNRLGARITHIVE